MLQSKNINRYLEILIILLVLIPHLFIVFSHQNILLDWFNTDDGFYYYKTAQNIVAGKGFTFDGFGRTNGFQPLWMIVLLPIFFIARSDLITPLRLVVGLQTLLSLGTSLILFRTLQKTCSKAVSFLLALSWSLLPEIQGVTNMGGMEAGLNAFFMILFWSQAYRVIEGFPGTQKSLRQIFGLSILAVLTLFSRLDNVFFVYLMGAWVLWKFWQESTKEKEFSWRALIQSGFIYFAPLSLALGGYMLINKVYFGAFMPVSGTIKRWWGTLDYTVYGVPPEGLKAIFREVFSDNGNLGPFSGVVRNFLELKTRLGSDPLMGQWTFGILLAILLILAGLLIYAQRNFVKKSIGSWHLLPILMGSVFHIAYYKGFGQVAQKRWYWILENFLVLLIVAVLIESLARFISQWKYGKTAVILAVILLTFGLVKPSWEQIKRVAAYSPSGEHLYLENVHWIEAHTEPGSIIGMTGAGSAGYFMQDRVVVNLDGLINSVDYFIHLQNATADQYFASIGGDYVYGNAYILQSTNPYLWNFDQRLEPVLTYEYQDEYRNWVLFRFR